MQLCLEYGFTSTQRVDAVVADLLTTYAGIPASAITTADWTAEANQWLTNYNLQNIISEPTELNKLLDQICVECGVDIWVDDVANKIRFKAQVPTTEENDCIGDNVHFAQQGEHSAPSKRSFVAGLFLHWQAKPSRRPQIRLAIILTLWPALMLTAKALMSTTRKASKKFFANGCKGRRWQGSRLPGY